ncbi:MAG: TVP38/TMEM64 family protein [Gammaproteobacteria bacterium]
MNSAIRRLRRFAPRLIIAAVIVAAILLFFLLGGAQWLNLKHLLAERRELHVLVQQHYLMALLIAGLAYMLMTALSIPGGTVLSLLIGFLFGLWAGGTLIVISATLGATIIFLIVRYLIGAAARTWFTKKPQAEKLLVGFERNAFNYLLFVRLVPLFPFWLVNLASAFTAIRLRQYMLGTFIGIVPGCFIYANLGQQLGNIQSLYGLVSPSLIGALVLLGLFALVPIIVRRLRG